MNKEIIDYIKEGLKDYESFYDVGIKFGLQAPDLERAATDKKYEHKSISTKVSDIWRAYLRQKSKLELTKEVYKDNKLKFETFKKAPEKTPDVDINKFSVKSITTNPYGGAWIKYEESVDIAFNNENITKLKNLLLTELRPRRNNCIKSNTEKGLFIYGSDKHIGANVTNISIYKNNYTKENMKKRIIDSTLNIILDYYDRAGIIESLFIMDLGDALDGFNNKTTRDLNGKSNKKLEQSLSNIEQFNYYVEIHKELFDAIVELEIANNIYFISNSNSNHGGDFEYTAMKTVETYLNIKYPFIRTYISTKFIDHFIYGTHCIIFSHGKDKENRIRSLPLTLDSNTISFFNDYIRINSLTGYNISIISGDLHQSATTYCNDFRYRKVLSQYGATEYSQNNFTISLPGISYDIINKNEDIILSSDIFFKFVTKSNTGIKI